MFGGTVTASIESTESFEIGRLELLSDHLATQARYGYEERVVAIWQAVIDLNFGVLHSPNMLASGDFTR